MKTYIYKTGLLFTGLLILLIVQVQAQEKTDNVSYNHIISKLTFTSRISKSTEQINEELIKEISERQVDFVLTSKDEEELRKTGASDLLIETIDKNASHEVKENLKEKFNSFTVEDQKTNINLVIETGKQYIRVFEHDLDYKVQIKYLKKAIPNLEKKLVEYKQQKQLVENRNNFDEVYRDLQNPIDNTNKQLPPLNLQDKKFIEAQILYKRYTDNYRVPVTNENIRRLKIALEAAKEFVEKYSEDEEFKPQIDYFKKVIPNLEAILNCCKPHPPSKRYKFDRDYKNKDWDDLFEIGEKLLENEPEFVDVAIVLASVGYDKIAKENPKSKNLAKAVFFAELAINLLEANKKSETEKYGAYDYEYKTKEFPDGRANALGWMNYIIGYLKYYHLNEKDAAIPYFQKALEYNSEVRKFAESMPTLNS